MDIALVLIFGAVFLLCYVYLNQPRNRPPGPTGVPVLGTIGFIRQMQKRQRDIFLMEEAKKYGPIICTKILNTTTLFLVGYDVIHQAFVKQADVFSDRPHWLPTLKHALKQGKGIAWQSGDHWKLMRRFTLQTLRDFGVGKTSLEEKIIQEVDDMSQILSREEPTDIRQLMSMAIVNVIYGITFGSRFDYRDGALQQLVGRLDNLVVGTGLAYINPLVYLPAAMQTRIKTQGALQFRKRQDSLELVENHIFSQIQHHKETYDPDNIRDFVDLYIQTVTDQNVSGKDGFNDGNVFRVIMDLFIAGSETTFNTLNWAVLYMTEHPAVQTRCQRELEEKFGGKQICWSDRAALPVVEATLLEVQRISNIVPLSLPHTTTVDTTLMGYKIPKDTLLFAVLTSANMDPKYWEEPNAFRPERFLNKSGKLLRKDAFMPFSVGPRTCMGETLARMEMFLIFSNLLQRFSFHKEDPDSTFDVTPRPGQFTNAAREYKAVPRRRM